jgi:hypothetical protein
VIFRGTVVAEIPVAEADEPTLLRAAYDLKPDAVMPEEKAGEAVATAAPAATEAATAAATPAPAATVPATPDEPVTADSGPGGTP